jgi:hypothetical protein
MRVKEQATPRPGTWDTAGGNVHMSDEQIYSREELDDDLDGDDLEDADIEDDDEGDDDLDDDELEEREAEERARFKEKLDTEFPLSGGETEEDF